jgi:hypothetical protein
MGSSLERDMNDRQAESTPSSQSPGICPYCGRRCRVPVTRMMPAKVQAAYEAAGVFDMATCVGGAAAEKMKFGASYADVIDARVREVMPQPDQRS